METVEDEDGRRFVLRKRSTDAWLILDPETGAERYRDPAELSVVADESVLETAVDGIDPPVRRLLTAVPNERLLGLVVTVVDHSTGDLSTADRSPADDSIDDHSTDSEASVVPTDRSPADDGTTGVAVRTLLAETTLCESDLHGAIGELVAAGLLVETSVAGERGYQATDLAIEAVESLRSG